jgi:hypothetical protein
MGKYLEQDGEFVYQQDDGEITAWFNGFEEKMTLPHEGSSGYKKIFYLLVLAGILYLIILFTLY